MCSFLTLPLNKIPLKVHQFPYEGAHMWVKGCLFFFNLLPSSLAVNLPLVSFGSTLWVNANKASSNDKINKNMLFGSHGNEKMQNRGH